MSLTLVVDLDAAVPAYEQIRSQIAGHVLTGTMNLGDRLPTVRALAADLGVAVNTVARAYQELEAAGLVHSRRRTGTVVTHESARPNLAPLRRTARRLADQARRAGVEEETTIALVHQALSRPSGDEVAS